IHAKRAIAVIHWKRGHLSEALALAEQCVREAAAAGQDLSHVLGNLMKGMILLHAGDFAAAFDLFRAGVVGVPTHYQSRASLLTSEFLGDVHREQGQAEAALKYYDEVWPQALALLPKGDIVAELRRRRAECWLLMGRAEDAYVEAETGLAHCREMGD